MMKRPCEYDGIWPVFFKKIGELVFVNDFEADHSRGKGFPLGIFVDVDAGEVFKRIRFCEFLYEYPRATANIEYFPSGNLGNDELFKIRRDEPLKESYTIDFLKFMGKFFLEPSNIKSRISRKGFGQFF